MTCNNAMLFCQHSADIQPASDFRGEILLEEHIIDR